MGTRQTTVRVPGLEDPGTTKSNILITSVRVSHGPFHDEVAIWNRGGLSGSLAVDAGDGLAVALLLIPDGERSTVDLGE